MEWATDPAERPTPRWLGIALVVAIVLAGPVAEAIAQWRGW